MSIFDKRPLSLILCIMLGGFAFFATESTAIRVALIAVSVTLFILYLLSRRRREAKPMLLLCAFAILISSLLSYLYFDLYFKCENKYTGIHKFDASIVEIDSASYYTAVIVKTHKIDDKNVHGYRLVLALDNDEREGLDVGDSITFNASLESLPDGDFDERNYYYSQGVSARAVAEGEFTINNDVGNPTISLSRIRETIRRRAVLFSDELSGSLLAAFLIGERSALSAPLLLNFKRIGITHLLALSGIHLTILTSALSRILSLARVKKKPRSLICILFVLLYMTFTGFSVSVMRAGMMLIISTLLFLFAKSHDSITSLVCAIFVICICTPYAIFDVSLQLSAFATLGILLLSEYGISKNESESGKNILHAILKFIKTSILSSVLAITACLPFTIGIYGTLSPLAPISTLAFGILAEIIILLGIPMLIVGGIIPIGALLAKLCEFTASLASWLSAPEWVYVSADGIGVRILVILLCSSLLAFAILKIKHRKEALAIISCVFVITNAVAIMNSQISRNEHTVEYFCSSNNDSLLISSDSEICVVNTASGSNAALYLAPNHLRSRGVYHVDKYIVTKYSWGTAAQLEEMLSSVKVRELLIRTPKNKDERAILYTVFPICEEYGVSLTVYSEKDTLYVGDASLVLDVASAYGEKLTELAIRIYDSDNTITYLSPDTLSSDAEYPAKENILTSTAVIFACGSGDKDKYINYYNSKISTIILGSNNIFLSQDAYREYIKNGCEIHSHPSRIEILN